MEKNERKQYKQKIELYEKLGAVKFQKVVFAIERGKYRLLKKLFPNYMSFHNKISNFFLKRKLNRANSPEEYENILMKSKMDKMRARAEWNREKNRNYHMNGKTPTEIINYLKWNKDVHKRGLIKNGIESSALIVLSIVGVPYLLPFLAAEAVSTFLNFQCVNLQNYNICRYKISEEIIKKKEERDRTRRIENYGEAEKVIAKAVVDKDKESGTIDIEEIIAGITTKEQLLQLMKFLRNEMNSRNNEIDINKTKVKIGGNNNETII